MDVVFTIIGWASIPMLLLSVAFLVRQWHRNQRMTRRKLLLPVITCTVSLAFQARFMGVELLPMSTWLPLVFGFVGGVAISRVEDLRMQGGEVRSTKTAWSYAVWGIGFSISQGIALVSPASAAVGLTAVWATSGLTSGEHLGLLQRRYRLRHPSAPSVAPAAAAILVLVLGAWAVLSTPRSTDAADSATVTEAVAGSVDGLAVEVRGTGTTYSGDSIQLSFDNQTGAEQVVTVPIGTRFVSVGAAVQDMMAAGGERIVVPPGRSTAVVRAFCGNSGRAPPNSSSEFVAEEPDPESDLTRTLQRANELWQREQVDDHDIQQAVWSNTDNHDISLNEAAMSIVDLEAQEGPTERESGLAGAAGAAPSALVALQAWRRRDRDGDGSAGDDDDGGGGGSDGGGSDGAGGGPGGLVDEYGDVLMPGDDGLYDQWVDGEWRRVTRDEAAALIRDAQHWQRVNEAERRQALGEHDRWVDRQWDSFVDDCQRRAADSRRAAAAEAADRAWRLDTANRLETVALRNGYHDMIAWLDRNENNVPSADELRKLREFLGRRLADDAATSRYFDGQSDFESFVEGVRDDVGWVANQAGSAVAGPAGGAIAEYLARNPIVPVRIVLAVKTGGISEIPFMYGDMHDGLNAAADAKMAEQNLDLDTGEAVWEVAKVGLWEVGGRVGGDTIGSVVSGRGLRGGYTGIGGAVDDTAAAASRVRTASEETSDRFVQRVQQRLDARRAGTPITYEPPAGLNGTRAPGRDGAVRSLLREGDEIPPNLMHETGLTVKQQRSAGVICREENVEFLGRTTNMDSMRHVRDGTGVPKPPEIKSKTLKELDTYLHPDVKPGDEGLVGFFKPVEPDLSKVPAHLREQVADQFQKRADEFADLKPDLDRLVAKGDVVLENGKVIEKATGKPYTGDWDLVGIKDSNTGKFIGPGARYDHLKNRFIREVGGQHGAEMNVVSDLSEHLRPGTPEYDAAIKKGLDLRGKLQAKHTSLDEVVVQIGPDGALRRGPAGTDIDLSTTDFAPDVPPPVRAPTQPAGAGDAGSAMGGAVGETFRSPDGSRRT